MQNLTINDAMWHWIDCIDGENFLNTCVGDAIFLSIHVPEVLESDDVWMWCDRIQAGLWAILRQNGVVSWTQGKV